MVSESQGEKLIGTRRDYTILSFSGKWETQKHSNFPVGTGGRNNTWGVRIKKYITTYYKNLFGPSESTSVSLDESIRGDTPSIPVYRA